MIGILPRAERKMRRKLRRRRGKGKGKLWMAKARLLRRWRRRKLSAKPEKEDAMDVDQSVGEKLKPRLKPKAKAKDDGPVKKKQKTG